MTVDEAEQADLYEEENDRMAKEKESAVDDAYKALGNGDDASVLFALYDKAYMNGYNDMQEVA